jgi:23S rRNA pseudouridine1911/1915/1917 synthase
VNNYEIFFLAKTICIFIIPFLQLEIAFRQFDLEGNRLRQGPPEISTRLSISLPRADRLLKAAMRAVPLPADHDPIDVVFEDDDFIALNKPYGVITAPKHRYVGGSMVNRVIGNRAGLEPAVLHRLDMNTTGVVLFAKTRDIVPAVHLQFREKTARKEYLALVAGVPQWESCIVDAPIGHSPVEKVARAVVEDGKPAVTKFTVIASSPDADLLSGSPGIVAAPGVAELTRGAALIRCEPMTGRTHQIRVHLAHAGHPILGDDLYGVIGPWLDRQALHAASLSLEHPRLKSVLTVEAPLPKDFENALTMVGCL